MKTKRVIKKSFRNKIIVVILILIFIMMMVITVKHYTSNEYKLAKLGYTKEELSKIIELDKQDIVLSMEYNNKIVEILTNKYYLEKNLNDYIDFYNSNNDKTIDDVIAMVNVHANNEFYSMDHDADLTKGNAILINKFYKINADYIPENLVDVSNWYSYAGQQVEEEVYNQFKRMFNAAKDAGLTILINDSYRTFDEQQESWDRFGDEYAARSGYSEHNTGLAVDVVSPESNGDTFDQTEEFKWLQNHAHEYGFILRYPEGKEYLTGYGYESWHYRYLGVDLATKVHNEGITFDEYYAYYLEDK